MNPLILLFSVSHYFIFKVKKSIKNCLTMSESVSTSGINNHKAGSGGSVVQVSDSHEDDNNKVHSIISSSQEGWASSTNAEQNGSGGLLYDQSSSGNGHDAANQSDGGAGQKDITLTGLLIIVGLLLVTVLVVLFVARKLFQVSHYVSRTRYLVSSTRYPPYWSTVSQFST